MTTTKSHTELARELRALSTGDSDDFKLFELVDANLPMVIAALEDAERWAAFRRISIRNGSAILEWEREGGATSWTLSCGSIDGGGFDWLATDCKTADEAIDKARGSGE